MLACHYTCMLHDNILLHISLYLGYIHVYKLHTSMQDAGSWGGPKHEKQKRNPHVHVTVNARCCVRETLLGASTTMLFPHPGR